MLGPIVSRLVELLAVLAELLGDLGLERVVPVGLLQDLLDGRQAVQHVERRTPVLRPRNSPISTLDSNCYPSKKATYLVDDVGTDLTRLRFDIRVVDARQEADLRRREPQLHVDENRTTRICTRERVGPTFGALNGYSDGN